MRGVGAAAWAWTLGVLLPLAAVAIDLERPARDAQVVGGRLALDAKTICPKSAKYGRHCVVANAPGDAVVCVGTGAATNAVPGTVAATGCGGADFTFRDGRNGGRLPAVFRFPGSDVLAGESDTAALLSRNALGIAAAAPVRFSRNDPVAANEPWFLFVTGPDARGVELASLAVRAIRALPADVRRRANADGMTALTAVALLRRAQRGVATDDDWLSGVTHRPVLDPSRIDAHRLELLASSRREYAVPPPAILCRDLEVAGGNIPIVRNVGAMACRLEFEPGENEVRVSVKADTVGYAMPKWVLLQGDASFVRLTPVGRGHEATIAIDWKGPFDAPQADGRTLKSRRVDVGCFAVAGPGEVSLPAVCSFRFK